MTSKLSQIQGTNDSSIVSKLSAANKGYFNDKFLAYFVEKPQIRAPIINRGYYIRFKAMQAAIKSWCTYMEGSLFKKMQIISLGAGFDTTYFRLKYEKSLPPDCMYIEVDFPEVMQRKFKYIKKYKDLENLIIDGLNNKIFDADPQIVARSEEYILIGVDLNYFKKLEEIFNKIQVNYSYPTLFISECAITYIEPKNSETLIKWIKSQFYNCVFLAYEQVHPKDGFGLIMKKHFLSIGSPLKSLLTYPDEKMQQSRFIKMGWLKCKVLNVYHFYENLSIEEKLRIKNIEMFDEYEMLHEKCQHYVLIWACNHKMPFPEMFNHLNICENTLVSSLPFEWKFLKAHPLLQRYGHKAVLLSSDNILIFGGFGCFEKRHQRLGDLVMAQNKAKEVFSLVFNDSKKLLGQRLFHSLTILPNKKIVVLGGRAAPNKVFSEVIELNSYNNYGINQNNSSDGFYDGKVSIEHRCELSMPTWRHSASCIELNGINYILVFGGYLQSGEVTNNCYLLNTEKWLCFKIPSQTSTPSPMHSHSSVTLSKHKVIFTGGLSQYEKILNYVFMFDAEQNIWLNMNVIGLFPRYSHTSHLFNNQIFLIGGITNISGIAPTIAIINLETLHAFEFRLPIQDPEFPIILSNHCSCMHEENILIIGGGGNCFSFGTHFNKHLIHIKIGNIQL